jgi:lysophospholipase L1-like esterase
MSRSKNLAKNLIAVLIGLAFALAALEGVTRLFADTLGISSYMQYDELLGWVARPDATRHHRSAKEGFDVVYRINDYGLRGTAYDTTKPEGVRRIVVLGDSNGFGWGIDENSHFAALLDQELDKTEVVNFSLSGYGTDQQYLRFRRDGIELNPDVVILQLTPNDFAEIQYPFFKQKAKPQFLLDDSGELELVNVPVRSMGPNSEEFYRKSLPVPFKEWLGWNSYSYNYLNQQYHSLRMQLGSGLAPPADLQVFSTESIALFSALVSRLRSHLDELGATGLIVYSAPELHEKLDGVELDLPVVDVFPKFADAQAQGQDPWYSDRYHWNELGHRLIADELKAILTTPEYLDQDAGKLPYEEESLDSHAD